MTEQKKSVLHWIVDILAVLAGALVCVLVVIVCVDIFARNTNLFSVGWRDSAARFMLYFITFLGAPWVLWNQGHIVVDLVLQSLKDNTRRRVERVAYSVCAVVCLVLTYFASWEFLRLARSGRIMEESDIQAPEWYLFTIAPPIFLLLAVIFIRWIWKPPAEAGNREGH